MAQQQPLPLTNDNGDPTPPQDWDRCHAYIKKKGRFCSQLPLVSDQDSAHGARFCGNHQHLLPPHTPETTTSTCGGGGGRNNPKQPPRLRIPCPVDPSHSIYADMVQKHVGICPATKKRKSQQEQPFYQHNLNTGGHGDLLYGCPCRRPQSPDQGSAVKDDTAQVVLSITSLEEATKLAVRILQVHQTIFKSSRSSTQRGDGKPAAAQELQWTDIFDALPVMDLSPAELAAGLPMTLSAYRVKSGGPRHVHQQASLVGHLRRMGAACPLLPPNDELVGSSDNIPTRTIVEVGAGRGMTGLVVSGVLAGAGVKTKLIMVERAGSRGKADTVLRNLPATSVVNATTVSSSYPFDLASIDWERVQCDMAHVDMACILPKEQQPSSDDSVVKTRQQVVVVAKHLCGVGTDLAMKSLEPVKDKLYACIFCTCCHGACSWAGYVGRDYLRKVMETDEYCHESFGQAEFELLRKWASAGSIVHVKTAAAGVGQNDDDDDEHGYQSHVDGTEVTGISAVVRALKLQCGANGLGRACQRLIDYGRREYLRQVLFPGETSQVEMLYYVSHDITPQNAALIAYRRP